MQSRFWVASFSEYADAHDAKVALQLVNEDKNYQIRKGRDKKGIVFRVVERLRGNEAEVVNDARKKRRVT